MSDTIPNAFIGQASEPTGADLEKALGAVKSVWDGLIAGLEAEYGVATREWKSYSLKSGWALRLMRGKRTIIWLAPCSGCFQVAFILGDKALQVARQSKLSAQARRALDEAQKYPEGTGVRLLIKGAKDIPAVKKLALAKIEK